MLALVASVSTPILSRLSPARRLASRVNVVTLTRSFTSGEVSCTFLVDTCAVKSVEVFVIVPRETLVARKESGDIGGPTNVSTGRVKPNAERPLGPFVLLGRAESALGL